MFVLATIPWALHLCSMQDELVHWGPAIQAGVTVHVRRLDLLDGNKGFKLQLNLERALAMPSKSLLTFGGPWSNHLHATAKLGAQAGLRTIGLVRGGETDTVTLQDCRSMGMELVKISRTEYAQKLEESYLAQLRDRFQRPWIVPEGGANTYGLQGCQGIVRREEDWDAILVSVGTGTTLGGIVLKTGGNARIVGVSALKGVNHQAQVARLLHWSVGDEEWVEELLNQVTWWTDAHAGGFGKMNARVAQDWKEWEGETGIPLDRVYTAKLISRLKAELVRPVAERSAWMKPGARLLVIHTGGLQGNRSFMG